MSPTMININLHLNGFMHHINSSAVLCISWKHNDSWVDSSSCPRRWKPLICGVVLGEITFQRLSYLVQLFEKAICHILGGKLHTQDGFLKHILLLCFSWQGFIFRIKTVSLTHLQCYFYKTYPSELLRFKISLWFTPTDIQGTFLKRQFCNRLINMSIWIKFFIAVVSEIKNCTLSGFFSLPSEFK